MEKIEMYKATDGTLFKTEKGCLAYESEYKKNVKLFDKYGRRLEVADCYFCDIHYVFCKDIEALHSLNDVFRSDDIELIIPEKGCLNYYWSFPAGSWRPLSNYKESLVIEKDDLIFQLSGVKRQQKVIERMIKEEF